MNFRYQGATGLSETSFIFFDIFLVDITLPDSWMLNLTPIH